MKKIIFIILCIFVSHAFAQSGDTIPFILKKNQVLIIEDSRAAHAKLEYGKNGTIMQSSTEEVLPVKGEDLSKLLCNVINAICPSIKVGEFKVWIKGEASGKFLGIGSSGEAGIEVTLKCDQSNNKKIQCS